MKLLSNEVKSLLDKLYNLRSDDSVILAKMNQEREAAIETQERTRNEKDILQQRIEQLSKEEKTLSTQGNKLINVLSNINRDDFAVVLERLNVDFEPDQINDEVRNKLPEAIQIVTDENNQAQEELRAVESELNNAIMLVEELGIRKDEALSDQAKLNEYLELALSGNINITRDAITSLLEKLGFSETEQRETAKILMFPEDALYEYDANIKSSDKTTSKSMAEVFAEAKNPNEEFNNVEENVEEEIKSVLEDTSIEELATLEDISELDNNDNSVVEEDNTPNKETLLNTFAELNISEALFSPNELATLVENYDKELFKNNIDAIKELGLDINILKNNAMLLYDKELKDKISKLLDIGKVPDDINLMPNVLKKYDLKGLTDTINVLQTSGLDPKKVPLMAF